MWKLRRVESAVERCSSAGGTSSIVIHAALFHFRAIPRGWFRPVILVNHHGLIGVEGAAAAAAEGDGVGVDYVACLVADQGELVPALVAARKVVADQVGSPGVGSATGGRSQFRERCPVLAILRVVLRLCYVQRADGANSRRFLG